MFFVVMSGIYYVDRRLLDYLLFIMQWRFGDCVNFCMLSFMYIAVRC